MCNEVVCSRMHGDPKKMLQKKFGMHEVPALAEFSLPDERSWIKELSKCIGDRLKKPQES